MYVIRVGGGGDKLQGGGGKEVDEESLQVSRRSYDKTGGKMPSELIILLKT